MKNTGVWLLVLLGATLVRAATLQEVVADPKLWPAEVLVPVTAKATVIKNGQPGGMMLVGAGKKITVTGVAADGVTGKMGGATVKVAVDKTDLMQRLDPSYVPAVAAAMEAGDGRPEAGSSDSAPAGPPSVMQRRLSGKVVKLAGNVVQPVDDKPLTGVKYYGIYYSASWCGPCRQFTPSFINTYRQIKQKYPEFEVVFISSDRSAEDMREYMKADRMPWLALKYELRGQNPELMRYAGDGIPCLVLVDASGRVLADSYQGGNYVGPGHVLRETIRILEGGR
jgi:nucleoredoxin